MNRHDKSAIHRSPNSSSGAAVHRTDTAAHFSTARPIARHPWQLRIAAGLLIVWNLCLLVMAVWG